MLATTARELRALRMKTSGKPLVPVLAFFLALSMWGYYAHTRQLIAQRLAANGFPERNFSDLFPRWLATRELLLNGCDPYSAEVTRDIQRGYYGRPLDRSRATDPIDEQRFAYPLFVVFLLAPTIGLPFTVVKSLFTLLRSASAVWTVLLWSVSGWRSRKWVAISFFTVLIVFMLASEVLLPGWSFQFLAGILPYLRYTQATTSVHQLFGRIGETIVLVLLAAMVALAAWRARFEAVDSGRFCLAVFVVLVFTCVFIPSLAPHNQVLLVPAYLLLVKERKCIWAGGRIARSLWSAAWLTVVWPWVAGTLLATTLVFDLANSRLWDLPLATNPLIPIAAFAALVPLLVRQADRATSFG